MKKNELEQKIMKLAGVNPRKWIAYGVIGGFLGGYLTAVTAMTLSYNADVRKTLTEAHRPPEEQKKGFDLFERVEDAQIPMELPAPFKF